MSTSDPSLRFVPGYLLYLLAAASEKASDQFHAEVRRRGFKVPEWRVLACLQDDDGAMITSLTTFAMMEQSRLTRIIDRMCARGLVERRTDEADGRRLRVFLTEEGKAASESLVDLAKRHETELLGALEHTDAARIKPVLQALLDRLDRADDPRA